MKVVVMAVGCLVLIVAGALLGPGLVNWNSYKPAITAAIAEHTGHHLEIDGSIELQVLPSPRFTVSQARLATIFGGEDAGLVRLDMVQARVALVPLLGGVLLVESLDLIRPVITLDLPADGRGNWLSESTGSRLRQAFALVGRTGSRATVRYDHVEIVDGTIDVWDGANGQTHRIEHCNVVISLSAPGRPFEAEATGIYRGTKFAVFARLGDAGPGNPAPASLRVEMPDDLGQFTFRGTVDFDRGTAIAGEVAVEAGDFHALATTIAATLDSGDRLPPFPRQPLKIQAAVTATSAAANVSNLDMQLGGTRLTGVLQTEFSEEPIVTADIALGHLDLNVFSERGGAMNAATDSTVIPAPALLVLPTGVTAFLSLSVDSVSLGKGTIRKLNFEGTLDRGALAVEVLTAKLPGGTNARLDGMLYADGEILRFIGRSDAASDNLQAILKWWDVPLPDLSSDRLRRVVFGAEIDVSPDHLQLDQWRMDIDSTKVTGSLQARFSERPAFGLDIVVDTVNLDAYLRSGVDGPGEIKPATDDPDAVADALIAAVDADIRVRIGEARYREMVLHRVYLDTLLRSGQIMIRDLSVDDLAGAALSVSGTVEGPIAAPESDLKVVVEASSAARLARLVGLEVTDTVKTLGHFHLTSLVSGTLDDLAVDGTLETLGGSFEIKGRVVPEALPPPMNLSVVMQHPDAGQIVGGLVGGAAWQDLQLGSGILSATLVSRPDDGIDLDATLELAGGRLHTAGVVRPFVEAPSLETEVSFWHPRFGKLLQQLAPDFNPAPEAAGAATARFAVRADADNVTVPNIELAVGSVHLSGDGMINLQGARPKLALTARIDTLDLGTWWPVTMAIPLIAAESAPAQRSNGHWSRETIDLAVLQTVDASVMVIADRFGYRSTVVDDLEAAFEIEDGVLTLDTFTGILFGGMLSATGSLTSGDIPEMALTINVRDAVIDSLEAGPQMFSGVLDSEAYLKSAGRSAFTMMAALSGDGRFSLRDGVADGMDLPAMAELFDSGEGASDLLAYAREAAVSGRTEFESLAGSYAIVDGQLKFDDVVFGSSVAIGDVGLTINLPAQELESRSWFRLTDHPEAPPIGLHYAGPLDDPRKILEIEAMQAYLLERTRSDAARDEIEDNTVPGPLTQPAVAVVTAAPEGPVDHAAALRNILRALVK